MNENIPKYSRKNHKSSKRWLRGCNSNSATLSRISGLADNNLVRYKVVSTDRCRLSHNSALSAYNTFRKVIRGKTAKGCVTLPLYFSLSVTEKGLASRMGKGKGSFSYWTCPVRKGDEIFVVEGVSNLVATKAYSIAKKKLGFSTRLVKCTH